MCVVTTRSRMKSKLAVMPSPSRGSHRADSTCRLNELPNRVGQRRHQHARAVRGKTVNARQRRTRLSPEFDNLLLAAPDGRVLGWLAYPECR